MYSLNFFIKKSPFFEKFNTFNMSFYDNSVCTEVKSPQTTAPDLNNQTVRFKSDTNLIIFFNSFAVFDKKLFVALKIERRIKIEHITAFVGKFMKHNFFPPDIEIIKIQFIYNMINRVDNMKKTALWLAVIILMYQAVTQTEMIKSAVDGGVMRCINIIIPSLFFMMCVSGIVVRSGIISRISFVSDRFSRLVFGMNSEVFVIFLLSMLAGYPIGAKMLNELYNSGKITKEQAEKYLCVCYGAGGAFIFGCVTQYGKGAGKLIMLSNVLANIVIAFILGLIFRKQLSDKSECQKISGKRGVMLCESVADASKGMLMLCGMIIFFSALIAISEPVYSRFVTSEQKMGIIRCLLDVSAITELNIYTYKLLPIVSGLISFGGICNNAD